MDENNQISEEIDETAETNMEEDSDSSSDEENDGQETKIAELLAKITENPYMYDTHIELITVLRKEGEFDRLREAREKMNTIFPLTEELWLSWIEDEQKVVDGKEGREEIVKLFDRAVKDYMNAGVWLEYVQFAIGGMGEENGIENVRSVFERALQAVGLHVTKGATVWEAYREFENAILAGLQPTPGAIPTPEQQEQIACQTKKIVSLFKRQLGVPLIDMETTYAEFKEWSEEEDSKQVQYSYNKALEKLKELEPYEDSLLTAVAPRLDEYNKYIDYELSHKDPARIQCIFERALEENCLVADVWVKYTKYLDQELQIRDIIMSTYERAVRNCPWCCDIWVGYIRAMERHYEKNKRVVEVFERALTAGFASAANYLELWVAYCDYYRRRVYWEDDDHENDVEALRNTFGKAINYLQEHFALEGDPDFILLKYWARIEAKFCRNMEKCRECWNQIMQLGNGNKAAMWLEYFTLERSFGDHKHCRKVLQRALNSVNDYPEHIVEAFINFEREEGTLEQYDQSLIRCSAQIKRIEERRAKAAEKEAKELELKKHQRKERKFEKTADKKKKKPPNIERKQTAQKQTNVENIERIPINVSELENLQGKVFTRQKPGDEKNKDADGFKVPDLPQGEVPKKRAPPPGFKPDDTSETTTQKSKALPPGFTLSEANRTAPKRSKAPPPGFQAPASDAENGSAESLNEPAAKRQKVDETEPPEQLGGLHKENCTVFVSNLDFNTRDDMLRDLFSSCGKVIGIRLIKGFKGKSKGYGYVEFIDEMAVLEALKLDRTPIKGRPAYVSKCDPQRADQQKFKFSTTMEKNKIFIRGLPHKYTQENLQELCSKHGNIKSARLVTYKNGQSKGLAYVDYETDQEASQAVLKLDAMEIGEHTINVAISNPPARKEPLGKKAFTPTLGGGKTHDVDRGGRSRTMMTLFQPRSIKNPPTQQTVNKPKPTAAADTSATDGNSKQMSNADFRSMLLGKK